MKIGEQLRLARIERGYSLSDVSEKIRVRERIIQDLENDLYQSCGGTTYARGHIRNLARIYSMDVEAIISQFEAIQSDQESSMRELLDENYVTTSVEAKRPSWKVFGVAAAVATFVIGAFQVVPGLISSDSSNPISSVAEDVLGADDETPAVASAVKGVTIKLEGIDSVSWVKVSGANGATIFEGKIREGQAQEFFDDQLLQLIIGNAGAISISYNGERLGTSGNIGEVTRLQFTPDSNSAG